MSLPTAIAVAELVVIVLLVLLALRLRHRYEAIKLKFRTPMPSVLPRDFDPRFRETEIGPTLDAEVTLSVERHLHGADVHLSAHDGESFVGREESEDMYASIDLVVDKIRNQLVRNRGRRSAAKHGEE